MSAGPTARSASGSRWTRRPRPTREPSRSLGVAEAARASGVAFRGAVSGAVLGAVLLVCGALAGCGASGYRPTTPVAVVAAAATLEVEVLDYEDGPVVALPDQLVGTAVSVRVRWHARADGT